MNSESSLALPRTRSQTIITGCAIGIIVIGLYGWWNRSTTTRSDEKKKKRGGAEVPQRQGSPTRAASRGKTTPSRRALTPGKTKSDHDGRGDSNERGLSVHESQKAEAPPPKGSDDANTTAEAAADGAEASSPLPPPPPVEMSSPVLPVEEKVSDVSEEARRIFTAIDKDEDQYLTRVEITKYLHEHPDVKARWMQGLPHFKALMAELEDHTDGVSTWDSQEWTRWYTKRFGDSTDTCDLDSSPPASSSATSSPAGPAVLHPSSPKATRLKTKSSPRTPPRKHEPWTPTIKKTPSSEERRANLMNSIPKGLREDEFLKERKKRSPSKSPKT